jgi:hypothetical protein
MMRMIKNLAKDLQILSQQQQQKERLLKLEKNQMKAKNRMKVMQKV